MKNMQKERLSITNKADIHKKIRVQDKRPAHQQAA